MESALGWIGELIQWFGQLIPRLVILDPTQGGVRLRRGNEVTELVPGIHIYWPIITLVKVWPTARQTIDLTTQTFETKDGVTVQVSGMLAYTVSNIVALLTSVYEPDNTIRDIGMTVVQEVLIQYTWEELRSRLVEGTLRKELVKEAQRELRSYGIRVMNVGVKDLSRTTVYKVALEQSTDGTH